ncbi:MAG TPA: glucose-6-phosphate dehydrogenase assembly protein OpcA [Pyrinomonadaceae bacterium]|nr:glucose-6-phosphate dehydrogenase assembly protein OpcA [Pyrinomonadaceae bacterium]
MPLETQVSELAVSPSKGLDIQRIEKQLTSMWSEAGTAESSHSGVTRACTLNLIVYTTPEDDASELDELLNRVNEQHPGRTLILIVDRDAKEAKLDGYVSTRCRLLGGTGKQICGEQVTIEASGPTVETVASAVTPLLVPDVPVYLWWKDIPHYQDKLFDRLADTADRIVIDSSAFDHPHEDLRRLAKMIEDPHRELSVSDLNWGRLTSWRTLLASFWDVPDYRPLLDSIDTVEIEYVPPQSALGEIAPKALLLAGWLSSRLNWVVVDKRASKNERSAEFNLKCGESSVLLAFRRGQTANTGMLSSVRLSTKYGAASFYVGLHSGGTKLQTEAKLGAEHLVGRLLTYERRSEADRLSRELAFPGRDLVYEEALARGAQLIL